ncbi:hypothetical protein NDU88_002115 [Pleurodeles waltl]|uniref:DUF4371 domain-containing protein n=1 Tax=Pleurodeles waltl TaxID=8319 RepID=A0AAV7TK96_PLEWA|nr:hypothetical protein NDU88_002115 [Pleurodeles waltl]
MLEEVGRKDPLKVSGLLNGLLEASRYLRRLHQWLFTLPDLKHYKTRHARYTENFPLHSKLRSATVALLKQSLLSQLKLFLWEMKESEAVTEASFKICFLLAKHKKPFTEAELVKKCFLSATEILFENYSIKASIVKEINALQQYDSTCAHGIGAMGENVQEQVIKAVTESPFFSMVMDESTDIGDVAQLLVWVRYLDQSFHLKEELLCAFYHCKGTQEEKIYWRASATTLKHITYHWTFVSALQQMVLLPL